MSINWKPSEDFRNSPNGKAWQQIAESEVFRKAMEAAYVQTMFDLPKTGDMGQAAANEFKRQGATMALFRLMNLNSPGDATKERDVTSQNLDHKV